MQIQRIQSIYLFIAAIVMGLINFVVPIVSMNLGEGETATLTIANSGSLPLLILNMIIAVVLFVTIFLFNSLPFQMKVTRISIVLIVFSALIEAWILTSKTDGEALWIGSYCMLAAAFLLTILALNGMKRDYKLIRESNSFRLRD